MDDTDGPAAILSRLAAERRTTYPVIVLPEPLQWRILGAARERWAADTIVVRPEFGDRVKLKAAPRARFDARVAWMSTDPVLSPADYLLETLRLSMHPRAGWTGVHLLGNRPSLVPLVLELGLEPLYPAAARHTRDLAEHQALIDRLSQCTNQTIRERSVEVFAGRTDVSWLLRHRAMRDLVDRHRIRWFSGVDEVSTWWNTLVFAEADDASAPMDELAGPVSRTRRGGARILTWPEALPVAVRHPAEATARRVLAAAYARALSVSVTEPQDTPGEVAALIATYDVSNVLFGESMPSRLQSPSVRPEPSAGSWPETPLEAPRSIRWRARPDGSVRRADEI